MFPLTVAVLCAVVNWLGMIFKSKTSIHCRLTGNGVSTTDRLWSFLHRLCIALNKTHGQPHRASSVRSYSPR
uniref:Putative secreted protein n=1 Tax=Anopheles aquasalis TaxID=42839 RepID=T1E921_ANOAQ